MRGVVVALVVGLMLAPSIRAHEGHDHKIMGTVSAINGNHLDVKATDGKLVTVTLNETTSIVREKVKQTAADIKVGDRVVIVATQTKGSDGKAEWIAKQVRLGTNTPPSN
jgi:predicted secreted protein